MQIGGSVLWVNLQHERKKKKKRLWKRAKSYVLRKAKLHALCDTSGMHGVFEVDAHMWILGAKRPQPRLWLSRRVTVHLPNLRGQNQNGVFIAKSLHTPVSPENRIRREKGLAPPHYEQATVRCIQYINIRLSFQDNYSLVQMIWNSILRTRCSKRRGNNIRLQCSCTCLQ